MALRVLQIVTRMDRGGLESFIMNMYRNVNRDAVQFDFLLHRDSPGAYDEEIRSMGGRLFYVPRANPFNSRYRRALFQFFAGSRYGVVHSHIDCMSAYPLAAARRLGVPVRVAHAHSSSQDKDLKYPVKIMSKRRIRREATHLFACGDEAGRWMFGVGGFEVIPNAVEAARYEFDPVTRRAARYALGIPEKALVVGHVGRFSPVKNHTKVLEVFRDVLTVRPGSKLLLVGDGDLRQRLEEEVKASDADLRDAVVFLGVRDDVPDLMQAMDVFLMPSMYEGLPLVLVEAQASGLPCLISDTIPEDCDFPGGSISRMALGRPAKEWAYAVVACASCGADRSRGIDAVRAAGFDAPGTAKRLERFYLEAARAALDVKIPPCGAF